MKNRKKLTPSFTWEILRTAKAYSNIIKSCFLCLHEKLAIITYPYPDELLNRRSELVTKCRHENKVLLKTLIVKSEVPLYGILLTHISETPSISNKKPSISI